MTELTARLSTALAGRYRIERHLGEGGMATVYLAEDLKHERPVALKVLRPELAAVLGAERFVQEIKTTAGLQHPQILPLFDSGEADSFLYYVMPYIEGETLRDKLNRETQLGVEEAVRITTEVADALDHAHRHDVIHRDIKPENILLYDGRPMVADFGIALAVSAAAGGRMTETGLSLGTPHYMSPEQATADKDITNRSDIYSLGSVLYEMLTGAPPHVGAAAQQIIMKIVTEVAPPVTAIRKSVPPNVASAVARALEKVPADRFDSAKAFAAALTDPNFVHHAAGAGDIPTAIHTRTRSGPLVWSSWLLTLVLGVLLLWRPASEPEASRAQRHFLAFAEGMEPVFARGRTFAFSRDGRRMVYVTGSERQRVLALKEADVAEPRILAGTENATSPAFSPDGERIVMLRGDGLGQGSVEVVALAGGLPQVVADSASLVASWSDDEYIYYVHKSALLRTRPTGGVTPDTVIASSPQPGTTPSRPVAVPGGHGVIYDTGGPIPPTGTMWSLDLRNGRREQLGRGVAVAVLPSGHLLYSDGADLFVTRFDLATLRTAGEPARIATGVRSVNLNADVAVSENGLMVYATAVPPGGTPVWADRSGTISEVDPAWDDPVIGFELSPTDDRLVAYLDGGTIVVKQLDAGPVIPIARGTARASHVRPSWHPSGEWIGYQLALEGGADSITARRPDGVRDTLAEWGFWVTWSPDGAWRLAARNILGTPGSYIVGLPTAGSGDSVVLQGAGSNFMAPQMAPGNRWLAYVSDETGQWEVFVRPFPNVDSTRITVSPNGGVAPRWSPDGSELYFVSADLQLMRAAVALEPSFRIQATERLLSLEPFSVQFMPYAYHYDVTNDGQRYILAIPRGGANFVWVNGWLDALPEGVR